MNIEDLKREWTNGNMSIEELEHHLLLMEECYTVEEICDVYEYISEDIDETISPQYLNNYKYQ